MHSSVALSCTSWWCATLLALLVVAVSVSVSAAGPTRARTRHDVYATTSTRTPLPLRAINRHAVVTRHDVLITAATASALDTDHDVLTVGNGAFAANVDISGLQTFNASYANLGGGVTLADWGWHTTPFTPDDPAGALRAYNMTVYDTPVDGAGRTRRVPYFNAGDNAPEVVDWMAGNPHRLNLGQLSLRYRAGGVGNATQALELGMVTNASQALRLWSGLIESNYSLVVSPASLCALAKDNTETRFSCDNAAAAAAVMDVAVETAAHPDLDAAAFRLQCSVRGGGGGGGPACPLALRLAFPYGSTAFGTSASEWNAPDAAHGTAVVRANLAGASLLRRLDGDAYRVDCAWDSGSLVLTRVAPHVFELLPTSTALAAGLLDVRIACHYAPVVRGARGAFAEVRYPVGTDSGSEWIAKKSAAAQVVVDGTAPVPGFGAVRIAAAGFWPGYWGSGAFADFASGNTDRAAFELERRVVLSQYLMRVNNAAAEPPQETGLLCNSWNGKHHSEMRFWHLAHWPLWGRPELLARSDAFYEEQLANATAYAAMQGYKGAHWPKETAAGVNASMFGVPWVGLDHSPWPFGGAPNGSVLVWESPQVANALIIWQQPHAIMLAELQRRAAAAAGGAPAAAAVVRRLLHIVLASADYLASRFFFNASDAGGAGRWWLGPPVLGGHETGDAFRTFQPTFEVVYAAHTLDLANEWRQAAGLLPDPRYDAVAGGLAVLPTDPASPPDGPPLYSLDRWCVCMYLSGGAKNPACQRQWAPAGGSSCEPVTSHPLVVGVLGIVNGRYRGDRYGVDARSANATLATVLREWVNWTHAWGWDDALLASAMLRLRWDPRAIVDSALLDAKFPYYRNGHTVCCPTYLPGNGGLLLSIALLAAGTTDAPGGHFPPAWGVVAEGFDVVYP